MDLARFKKKPIMGILRGVSPEQLEPLLEAVWAGGMEAIEVTMNTPDASELIRKAQKAQGNHLMIGAGTVLNMDSLKSALGAGATFIVMPCVIKDVLAYCVKNDIPVFPGAFSPLEIYNAWSSGAAMVKVFPAKFLGPLYLKEIKAPFNDIELLACAGVTPENIKAYFVNGASAIAVGASVFKKEWLANKDFKSIRECIKKYMQELAFIPTLQNRPPHRRGRDVACEGAKEKG